MSQSTDSSTCHVAGTLCDDTVAVPNVTQDTMKEVNHRQPPAAVVLPNRSDVVIAPPKKTAGCTRNQDSRHNGLKRSSNACGDVIQSRRLGKGHSRIILDVNADIVRDLDPNLSPEEVNAVINDYKHARRILNTKSDSKNDTIPTLEFMIGLVNDWRPKMEMICMYVRWSKRLRRNYHLDSISTLLCVAKQCDYKPYIFLKNIKTLSIMRSTTMYGLNFRFDTTNNSAIDGNKLNEKFLGLSITLRLLQEAVVPCNGALGSIGLRSTAKRARISDVVILGDDDGDKSHRYSVADKPTSRFHTTTGLNGRIWMAIQHRWIALQVVETLFPTHLAMAKSAHESLAYSFQMHACAGPSRFDFLDPIIGVCLRYRSTKVIENHSEILQSVWNDPKSFVPFGNRLLQSVLPNERIQYIAETFKYLYSLVDMGKNVILHKKTDNEDRWQMICGYAFHFWLERRQNKQLQDAVERCCSKKSAETTASPKPGPTSSTNLKTSRSNPLNNLFKPATAVKKTDTKCSRSPTYNGDARSYGGGLSQLVTSRDRNKNKDTSYLEVYLVGKDSSGKGNTIIMEEQSGDSEDMAPADGGQSLYKWDCIRLASQAEIASLVSSHLLIHRDDGVTIVEELSPLEVYSADMLYKYRHSRQTGRDNSSGILKNNGVVLSIDAHVQQFIDRPSRSFHVAREDSSFFKEHGDLVPCLQKISDLCKAVFKYGKTDTTRSVAQSRVNIGCGGQHRPNGIPERLIGLNFKDKLRDDDDFNPNDIMYTIGQLTEFTWNIMKDMQHAANDIALAPDLIRHRQYASHLADYLSMKNDVGFEDVTIVVGFLYPMMPRVAEHLDIMNDTVAGYTRTGAFNIVLLMGEEPRITLLHLQVICNFRRVIREHILPMESSLKNIVANCKLYMQKWQANINQVFGGKTQHLPTPLDRCNFFVDDCLPFETIVISNDSTEARSIKGEYLLTEISPSRVLSFSMFIDPIVDLRDTLCRDQLIELCFIASLLSNPFWFEYTLSSLTRKHSDKEDPFCFDVHPFYDWVKETCFVFRAWQGGPYNRWSPFGGNIPLPNLFGAQPGATRKEMDIGRKQMEHVLEVLHHHLQWVDNLHESTARGVIPDLSMRSVETHMTSVTNSIYRIVPCQFSAFRLLVFTTISAGCGLTRKGRHLKSLMYPVKGSASFKHIMKPHGNEITRSKAFSLCRSSVPNMGVSDNKQLEENAAVNDHDQLMLYVSCEVGMPTYLRDETECILCESHPNRNLQCRDWFKRGRRIYDMDAEGNILQREYGANTSWKEMPSAPEARIAFLKETILYVANDEALTVSAMKFGDFLRREKQSYKFCGRGSRTSDFVQEYNNLYMTGVSQSYSVVRYRAANFCYGHFVSRMNMTNMQVLGDGEKAVNIQQECNDIAQCPDGVSFWDNVLNNLYGRSHEHYMYAARYHQQHEESARMSTTSIFPGHLDKGFVHRAIFLPLTTREFFTILAVPSSWYIQQHGESEKKLQYWMQSLPTEESRYMHVFFQEFMSIARITMKTVDVDMRIFHNTLGSALAFPANRCYHTTIVPGNNTSEMNPRDMFIIHTAADSTQR